MLGHRKLSVLSFFYRMFAMGSVLVLCVSCGSSVGTDQNTSSGLGSLTPTGCKYNGQTYSWNDRFDASDGCNSCSCQKGAGVICTTMGCRPACDVGGTQVFQGEVTTQNGACKQCDCSGGTSDSCSLKDCDNKVCQYNGKYYRDATSFVDKNSCYQCSCSVGKVVCPKPGTPCTHRCYYDGKTYKFGETFKAKDGCQSCRCNEWNSIECSGKTCKPSTCTHDGKTYNDKQKVPYPTKTNPCICMGGGLACRIDPSMKCDYKGKKYSLGESVPADDMECNTCTCTEQGMKCTTKQCDSYCSDGGISYPGGASRKGKDDSCQRCECTSPTMGKCSWVACKGDECEYNGQFYSKGHSFPDKEGCNYCSCGKNKKVTCPTAPCQLSCVYDETTYKHGESFKGKDGCHSCTCDKSTVVCRGSGCKAPTCKYKGHTYQHGEKVPYPSTENPCICMAGALACRKGAK